MPKIEPAAKRRRKNPKGERHQDQSDPSPTQPTPQQSALHFGFVPAGESQRSASEAQQQPSQSSDSPFGFGRPGGAEAVIPEEEQEDPTQNYPEDAMQWMDQPKEKTTAEAEESSDQVVPIVHSGGPLPEPSARNARPRLTRLQQNLVDDVPLSIKPHARDAPESSVRNVRPRLTQLQKDLVDDVPLGSKARMKKADTISSSA